MLHKAKGDYKNLTSSELQTYQHMADKENEKYRTLHKLKKVSSWHAMLKELTTSLSVEEVADYRKIAKRKRV